MDPFFPANQMFQARWSRILAGCGCSPFRWRELFDPGDFNSRQAGEQIF
jgi:hypothetical protein